MKKWIIIGVLFFITAGFDYALKQKAGEPVDVTCESVLDGVEEDNMQERLQVLTNDLKRNTCLLPRPVSQLSHSSLQLRPLRNQQKITQLIRMKNQNTLFVVYERVADFKTINFFTLLCRKGYYVYALRQLLI